MDVGYMKELVKELLKLLEGTDVTEFEFSHGETRISLKKGCGAPASSMNQTQAANFEVSEIELSEADVPKDTEKKEDGSKQVVITSPMVGMFYRAPAPDAEPFVNVGDIVSPGQTVCIIEAMKLMNEIEADVRGKVVDILVENAQAVEYGEPLFVIELLAG